MNYKHQSTTKFWFLRPVTPLVTTALLLGTLINSQSATVTLTTSDTSSGPSGFNTGTHWSDGLAPSSASDYVVPDTKTIRNTNANFSFLGNSLTIQAGGIWNMGANGTVTVTNLTLQGGSRMVNVLNPGTATAAGNIFTIGGGPSNSIPVRLYTPNQSTCFVGVTGNLTNATGSTTPIEVGRTPAISGQVVGDVNSLYQFTGNNGGFAGGFRVNQDSKITFVSQNSIGTGPVYFTNNFSPGNSKSPQLILTNSFSFTNPVTVGSDLALTIQVSAGAVVTASGAWSYTNNLTLTGGGTFGIGSASTLPASPTISILNGSTLDVSAISGLTLGGASANLTLNGNSAVNGTLTASTGGTIRPGGASTVGNLTVGNLTLTGGATNVVDFAGSTNDVVIVTGNLAASGVTVIKPTGSPGNNVVGALFPIFKVSGTLGGTAANYSVDSSSVTQTYIVTNDTVNKIVYLQLATAPAPNNLVWRGDVVAGTANAWDVNASSNWLNGASGFRYYNGDNVTFNDTGATNQPTLDVSVNPGSVTFNSSSNYSLTGAGAIIGTSQLTKSGSGALTLATANSYSGGTVISGGRLVMNNGFGLGVPSGNIFATVTNGGSFDLVANRIDYSTKSVVVSGSGVSTNLGALFASTGQPGAFPDSASVTGVRSLSLSGDAIVGETSSGNGIWSVGLSAKGDANGGGANNLLGILDGQNKKLTKAGNDLLILFATNASPVSEFVISGGNTATAVGGFGGVLFEGNGTHTTAVGATCPITISNNAFIDTWDLTRTPVGSLAAGSVGITFSNNIIIGAGGGQIRNTRGSFFLRADEDVYNGSVTLNGPLTIQNTSTYGGTPNNIPTWGLITFNGAVTGTNSVLCNGPLLQYSNTNHFIVFNGNNTYSGGTVISNYVTLKTSTANQSGGSYTIYDGSGLDVAIGSGQPTLPMSSLTMGQFGYGMILSFERVTNLSTTLPVVYATNLLINVGGVTIVPPATGLSVGTYPLVKYNGSIGGAGFSGFTLGTLPSGVSATLVDNSANKSIDLQVTVAPVTTAPNFAAGGISVSGSGAVSLVATGSIGGTYHLWATTNLALTPVTNTWTLLGSGTVTTSPFTNIDLTATNYTQRFYLFTAP